jgi:dihydropteroate synthase-like protein
VNRILLVTGTLAAEALEGIRRRFPGIESSLAVLPITVAALMTADWLDRYLPDADGCDRVLVPGLLRGDLAPLERRLGVPVERGPKDLKDLPRFLGGEPEQEDYGDYGPRIVAEIVEAWRMSPEERLAAARVYAEAGADLIDLGGLPGESFPGVGAAVRALRAEGFRVSVDSLDPATLLEGAQAGAELLLSVHGGTLDLLGQLPCPAVLIPDPEEADGNPASLYRSLDYALEREFPVVADPLLSPLLFGFAGSLARYVEVRRRYPDVPLLMGAGNLTELVEADSVGLNALIAGVAEELRVDWLLTTEVVSWTSGTVRELDRARRMMRVAAKSRVLPKHMRGDLLVAKDPPFEEYSPEELASLAGKVRDRNFRIFVSGGLLHVFNGERFVTGTRPEEIFSELGELSSSHAFYMGRELERAALAARLGKKYVQEQPLRFGYRSEEPRA